MVEASVEGEALVERLVSLAARRTKKKPPMPSATKKEPPMPSATKNHTQAVLEATCERASSALEACVARQSNRHSGPVTNDFQEDITKLRCRMQALVGEEIVMDKHDGFVAPSGNADWGGEQRVRGKIVEVLHHGHFIAAAKFGNEEPTPLTASSFLLLTTEWCWTQDYPRDDDEPVPEGQKHARAMERARFLMNQLIDEVGKDLKTAVVLGLDGRGNDRRAYEQALDAAGVAHDQRPLVVTVEMNPVVALNQALRFGRHRVRYSRADWRRRHKANHVEGIERLLLEESGSLLSEDEKARVAMLYLDFCGSPDPKLDYGQVYARLPNLAVCGLTVARRQPNSKLPCLARLQAAAPKHMRLVRAYTHARVVCHVFAAIRPKPVARPRPARPKPAGRVTGPKLTIEKRSLAAAAAAALVGTKLKIPVGFWTSGLGDEWNDTLRVDDKLCFLVSNTYFKYRCALKAYKTDGTLYAGDESFTLTPTQAERFAQ